MLVVRLCLNEGIVDKEVESSSSGSSAVGSAISRIGESRQCLSATRQSLSKDFHRSGWDLNFS